MFPLAKVKQVYKEYNPKNDANNTKDDPENLTNKQINDAFEYLDQNNDNKLDFNEFKRVTEIIRKRIAPNLILWGIRLLLFSANAY